GPVRAAPPRELGQRRKRGFRAAVMIDQRPEGARADILAANKAKPVEPLRVGQAHAGSGARPVHGVAVLWPMRVSVPASRRWMLARCMMKTSTVRTANRSATRGLATNQSATGVTALATRADS